MKSILFTGVLILLGTNIFAQPYSVVQKVTKKCVVVSNEEGFYGLEYNKKLVQDFQFEEYDEWNGLINFYSNSGSVCWNGNGKKILEFSDAKILIGEGDYLFVEKKEQTSLYSSTGKEIVPFGKYEFDFYQNGVVVKNEAKQQAFYDEDGYEIVAFANQEVSVIDDYEDVIAVMKEGETKVLLNERISAPYEFSKLNDFTFAQNHEVTVAEYLYFLGSQQYGGFLYDENAGLAIPASTFFPDTTKVEKKLLPVYRRLFKLLSAEDWEAEYEIETLFPGAGKVTIYTTFQLTKAEKELAQFPVTGITKEQAEAYCKWMSLFNMERADYIDAYDSYATYRLPDVREWELIAKQAMDNDVKGGRNMPDSLNKENCMMFIYESKVPCKNYASYLKASKGGGSTPAISGFSDYERRYNVYGNVAEMTSEDGIAKGGSFAHSANSANLNKAITYSEAQPWLGFRVIGEYHY